MGPVILAPRRACATRSRSTAPTSPTRCSPTSSASAPTPRRPCDGADGILVGSGHIADRLRQAVDDPATNAKVRLGPPGVDTDAVRADPGRRSGRSPLEALAARLRALGRADARGSSWDRDPVAAADAVDWFAEGDGPAGDLRRQADRLQGRRPAARGLAAGAREPPGRAAADRRLRGAGRGAAQASWDGPRGRRPRPAARARRARARARGRAGRAARDALGASSTRLPDGYEDAARAAAGSVAFAGRLEHDEVAVPVAASDALVFPSTFPEAFGMVAAEAAVGRRAAGLGRAFGRGRGQPARSPPSCRTAATGAGLVRARRRRRRGDRRPRSTAGSRSTQPIARPPSASLRETVERLWSWEGVARGVLAASAGRARRAAGAEGRLSRLKLARRRPSGAVAAINRIALR